MSPLQFQHQHAPLWDELDAALEALEARKSKKAAGNTGAARVAQLYRSTCEHLALARARSYPLHMVERLDTLAQRAHRQIYRRHDYGVERLRRLFLLDFPRSVRAHRHYVLWAALAFYVPNIAATIATWIEPAFALTLLDVGQLQQFDRMYDGGDAGMRIGRPRGADTDWEMFGFYILNNISIAFQCFASGVLAGVGSVFMLVFNGLYTGAVAGYVAARGHGHNFWPFVATHSAFELTAIVIAGAAGMRMGHALLSPGRRTRVHSLRHAAGECIVLVYGFTAMLVIAAVLEAHWSSAAWLPPAAKYTAAALCWTGVLLYFVRQGRAVPGDRLAG